MKKKLEADLMSIAHGVLQMKNKSDINRLYVESQKLYEKLSVLKFVEEHFGDAKPTIGQAEIVEKMKHFFEEIHVTDPLLDKVQEKIVVEAPIVIEEVAEETILNEVQEVVLEAKKEEVIINEVEETAVASQQEEIVVSEVEEEVVEAEEEIIVNEVQVEIQAEEEIIEAVAEEKIEIEAVKKLDFLPAFELDVVVEEEKPKRPKEVQISFEDLLGADYSEPMFVKVEPVIKPKTETSFQIDKEEVITSIEVKAKSSTLKSVSLNDKFAKGITIGLNDRIAFVKQLFGNSDEDYNRVMNQLITYDNLEEAQSFIDEMVKPDYNNWLGKEEYAQRFMEIIEKKFA